MRESVKTTPPVPDPPQELGVEHLWVVVLGRRYLTDPKVAKNRMHLDIETPDIETEATRVEALGATRVQDDQIHEHGTHWVLMADPEGNEFCVCDGGT
jgi:hypothetical protein